MLKKLGALAGIATAVAVVVAMTLGSTASAKVAAKSALCKKAGLGYAGPLSGGAANVTVNLVQPGTIYGERSNLLDLRFSKIFTFSRYRTSVNLDLSNALNSSAVTSQNNNFAAWQVPTAIDLARFFKISANLDF